MAGAVDADSRPSGQGIGAAAAGIGTASTGVTQVSNMLAPAADHVELFSTVVAVLTVIGALLAVASFRWFQYARARQSQLDQALDRTPAEYAPGNDNVLAPLPQAEAA